MSARLLDWMLFSGGVVLAAGLLPALALVVLSEAMYDKLRKGRRSATMPN